MASRSLSYSELFCEVVIPTQQESDFAEPEKLGRCVRPPRSRIPHPHRRPAAVVQTSGPRVTDQQTAAQGHQAAEVSATALSDVTEIHDLVDYEQNI